METVTNVPVPARKRTHPIVLILIGVALSAVIGTALWFGIYHNQHPDTSGFNLAAAGFSSAAHQLDPAFKDVDGNLIADPPTDASKFIDPPTLVFCFVPSDDVTGNRERWKPFTDYLAKVTGKPVEYSAVTSTHDEIKAMHDGKLMVAGFNTGAVPPAVDIAGFVPVCALPTADGQPFTHSDIIVPTDSTLQNAAELKGHELTLTSPDSNSGYKAPLSLLRSNFGLQPTTDLRLRCSMSHEASIAGVAAHKYEAAAVADDMLDRSFAADTVKPDQLRVIYKSENFPTAGLGYVYNLKPELAQKVREALLSFDWKGTPLEKVFNTGDHTRFVPMDYKKDWLLVRQIDDEMGLLSGF
jgi:phosphonate transport system substrate-binding protein